MSATQEPVPQDTLALRPATREAPTRRLSSSSSNNTLHTQEAVPTVVTRKLAATCRILDIPHQEVP